MRFVIALLTGKFTMLVMRLFRRNATYLPGKLAVKICPDFLGRIGKPETVIGVTGTNGKTTVCNFLIDILTARGCDLLHNRLGSNINAGIASALIKDSSLLGKCKKQIAVLEIDERSSKLIYPYIQPNYLICTNLFRDSIRRNAHAEFIAGILNDSIPRKSKLILNGDDLIACNLAPENDRVYFGIGRLPTDTESCVNIINDCRLCPKCGTHLDFHYVRYHHIGNASCPGCDFASPDCHYFAETIDFAQSTIQISEKGEKAEYPLVGESLFNIYNMLAAIALLREMGLSYESVRTGFSNIKIVESRYSKEKAGEFTVVTHMAKGQNPIACSRVFEYVKGEPGSKEVILMLDDVFDAKNSSENITWLYDCDFEFLNGEDITRIVIGGVRAVDYSLRLLIAGVPADKLFCTEKELDTPEMLEYQEGEQIFILHELYSAELAFKVRDKVLARIRDKEAAV